MEGAGALVYSGETTSTDALVSWSFHVCYLLPTGPCLLLPATVVLCARDTASGFPSREMGGSVLHLGTLCLTKAVSTMVGRATSRSHRWQLGEHRESPLSQHGIEPSTLRQHAEKCPALRRSTSDQTRPPGSRNGGSSPHRSLHCGTIGRHKTRHGHHALIALMRWVAMKTRGSPWEKLRPLGRSRSVFMAFQGQELLEFRGRRSRESLCTSENGSYRQRRGVSVDGMARCHNSNWLVCTP